MIYAQIRSLGPDSSRTGRWWRHVSGVATGVVGLGRCGVVNRARESVIGTGSERTKCDDSRKKEIFFHFDGCKKLDKRFWGRQGADRVPSVSFRAETCRGEVADRYDAGVDFPIRSGRGSAGV